MDFRNMHPFMVFGLMLHTSRGIAEEEEFVTQLFSVRKMQTKGQSCQSSFKCMNVKHQVIMNELGHLLHSLII